MPVLKPSKKRRLKIGQQKEIQMRRCHAENSTFCLLYNIYLWYQWGRRTKEIKADMHSKRNKEPTVWSPNGFMCNIFKNTSWEVSKMPPQNQGCLPTTIYYWVPMTADIANKKPNGEGIGLVLPEYKQFST